MPPTGVVRQFLRGSERRRLQCVGRPVGGVGRQSEKLCACGPQGRPACGRSRPQKLRPPPRPDSPENGGDRDRGSPIVRVVALAGRPGSMGQFDHRAYAVEVAPELAFATARRQGVRLHGGDESLVVEAVGERGPGKGLEDAGVLGPEAKRRRCSGWAWASQTPEAPGESEVIALHRSLEFSAPLRACPGSPGAFSRAFPGPRVERPHHSRPTRSQLSRPCRWRSSCPHREPSRNWRS